MRKLSHIIVTLVALLTLSALVACEPVDDSGTAADRADTKGAATKNAKPKGDTKSSTKPKPDKPKETAAQAQARSAAEQYLDYTAFSRSGLIKQLEFDGYSTKDATYGTDAQHANWNDQAALSAKQYLDYSPFSRSGLIEQLKFDGYTQEQAEFGVKKVGL